MYKYSKLRGRIVEKFDTQEAFAKEIGKTPVYVSLKLSQKSRFNQSTIELWARALDIPVSEYGEYFFA